MHADPVALIQTRLASRPGNACALVAGLGRVCLAHFLVDRAMPNGLVRKHVSEGGPAGIQYGLRQAGSGKSGGVDITRRDVIEATHDVQSRFVKVIAPGVRNARVEFRHLALLACALYRPDLKDWVFGEI